MIDLLKVLSSFVSFDLSNSMLDLRSFNDKRRDEIKFGVRTIHNFDKLDT